MRNELEIIQTIENYLQGKMSAEEKKSFEQKLSPDKKLQEEVKLQQEIMQGIKGASLKMKAKKAYKKYTLGKTVLKAGIITGGTIIILAAGYFGYKAFKGEKNKAGNEDAYVLPELNENGEKLWANADKYLPYQKFTINAQKDTVIETEDGIVMAIPANCFLDKNGNPAKGEIEFEVKEAIEANDIMKAGLNTKSGDLLLETGGMFYMNARKDGESLAIDPKKGVYTEVPTDEIKPDMQLFEGKRMPDGSIDWINPKPLEKFLIPVNMNTLNFYPPEYEDTLAALGEDVENKKYKDSLYYSFARLFGVSWNNIDTSNVGEENRLTEKTKDTTSVEAIMSKFESAKIVTSKEYLNRIEYSIVCFPGFEKTLIPILKRNYYEIEIGRSDNISTWLKVTQYTQDIASTDELLGGDVTNIGINPSKIKSIWNKKFENTLISTREFEERCQTIHRSCNNSILDVYVNNLDKKMCTLDSMAAQISGMPQFHEFAQRNDGRVKTGARHLEKLREYYAEKTKLYTEAVTKTEKEFWNKHNRLDNEAANLSNAKARQDAERKASNFAEELEMNLDDAYRQIGKPRTPPSSGNRFGFTVGNTGWKNLDQYVNESTITRTTLNYTDPQSGKKAIIKYEALKITVTGQKDYDVVFAYLIPDKLNSFMNMPKTENGFEEKLNELLNYQLTIIAYKGKEMFCNVVGEVKPGNIENIQLDKIESKELDKKLSALKNFGKRQQLLDEASYRHFEMKTRVRQKQVMNITKFRERIQETIFPCMEVADTTTSMNVYPMK